jgi:hypothetical protein
LTPFRSDRDGSYRGALRERRPERPGLSAASSKQSFKVIAASMSPRCVNACGKLPICSPVVRACLPRVAQRVEKPFAKVAKVALAAATVLLLVAVFPQLLAVLTLVTIAAIAVFIVLGLAVGHLLAGPDPGDSAVLALSSALRHPGIALAIASGNSDGDLPMLQWTAADSGAGFRATCTTRTPSASGPMCELRSSATRASAGWTRHLTRRTRRAGPSWT